MNKRVIRHIIDDFPSNQDLFHGGGHERTAHSLSKAIVKFDKGDSAIGLDGSWGSGKSSVVEMAARKLSEKNDQSKKAYHFFTFDIWKSQGSGFRRSYLEHFITWAKITFPKKRQELQRIEKQVQGKTREIETNNHPVLEWYGIFVLIFLPFLPLYYFWARKVFDDLSQAGNALAFLYSFPFIILTLFVVGTLFLSFWKYKIGAGSERYSDFKTAISRMLLISSRQHQDHKVTQRVREVDPNDYEFHATLREILGAIQSEKDRVIMVLDNIDRLPKKEIKEYWALVRSIFSRTHDLPFLDTDTDILAIVPYDRKLIESNVSESEAAEGKSETSLSSLASRELFSKTFDEVLVVSPPVLSNAREFFADKLEKALPEQISSDDRFRAYRIFCELLNVESGTTTPRQIVSFVNDLSGLYELHDGKFRLPTVATYLAHQDLLTETPLALNAEDRLDPKIVGLAADDRLIQNLAAIVFNVHEDLAFQILLDDEIEKAIIAEEPDQLIKLSSAPGFDLRIDDVVQANVDEWRSTGEFGTAAKNISELLAVYQGDAKAHVKSVFLRGFERVDSISIDADEYSMYLPLFWIATEKERPSIVSHLINAVFIHIHQQETNGFKDGQNLASFLEATNAVLVRLDSKDDIVNALGVQTVPSSPEYIFGLSSKIYDAGFNLGVFKDVSIKTSGETQYFEEQFVKLPKLGISALHQLSSENLLADEEWLSIANASLAAIKSDDAKSEHVGDLLEIVAMTFQNVEETRRSEINLDSALTDGNFFRNVGGGETEPSQVAQANLLFLAHDKLGESLRSPTKRNSNGQRLADSSDAFESFEAIWEGGVELEVSQVKLISRRTIEARKASAWISFGKNNRGHKAVEQVVLEMFFGSIPPYLKLKNLLSNFAYLEDLFVAENLTEVFRKYAKSFNSEEIEELTLEDLPKNFLQATYTLADGGWGTLHNHVNHLLESVDSDAWPELIRHMDHTTSILIEKLNLSGCKLDAGNFRRPFVDVVNEVLSGQVEIEAAQGSLDTLLKAIDANYHEEIWRTLREKISGVTPSSLEAAMYLFPLLVSDVAHSGNRISKAEKDNVVRNLLSPALEGRNRQALTIFINMGYTRLKDYQDAAEQSSTSMLEGAWMSFKDTEEDMELLREVSEAIYGKKKAKSLFDPAFWFQSSD
ncbi:P-loop NTPase fold protein [Halomonas sp. Mc5H-6]|uniref:P-loop NTPase fold protein n=1 Tax=Halomonas sp. Mc5H-6 TaxID=2954500 RepID=UPI0020981ECD|nr:P-loop NTPase fold protein [Halomonas sp. Mc5H-6]MCO7247516.1 KAP family NTPase [Halomonas sp. Mc5H-6]